MPGRNECGAARPARLGEGRLGTGAQHRAQPQQLADSSKTRFGQKSCPNRQNHPRDCLLNASEVGDRHDRGLMKTGCPIVSCRHMGATPRRLEKRRPSLFIQPMFARSISWKAMARRRRYERGRRVLGRPIPQTMTNCVDFSRWQGRSTLRSQTSRRHRPTCLG